MPLPRFPFAISNMMQGLAFWIGHRHSLYSGHKLPEAALVVEASNLVNARLKDNFKMLNEVEYAKLTTKKMTAILKNHSRADMIIFLQPKGEKVIRNFNFSKAIIFVIEFKRADSNLIDFDLQRLAEIKSLNKNIRALLIVVSESKKPKDFVDDENKAKSGVFPIPGSRYKFKIRRVCKAAASFKEKSVESTHYVCALEIVP